MKILETEQLILRLLTLDDAQFIYELTNDPKWLRFIGDRGIRTHNDAREYISNGPLAMQKQFGFCLYLTELKGSSTPIGLCGLIKRDSLDDIDLGFGFLPKYRSQGFAYEAAQAVVNYARRKLGLDRLVAIVSPENSRSKKLLEKLSFEYEKVVKLKDDDIALMLYSRNF